MRRKSAVTAHTIEEYVNTFFDKNRRSPSLREMENELHFSRQTIHRYLIEMNAEGYLTYDGKSIITDHIDALTKHNVRQLPIIGSIACGFPASETQQVDGYIDIPESFLNCGEYFVLKARGDSMKDAGIDDGDAVIVRSQQNAEPGNIVVAIDDENKNTLKRLLFNGSRFYLHPENRKYPDLYLSEIKIQGVAIKVIKDLE